MALDFLILYEHTVREYESDLLLKLELERRGYTAVLAVRPWIFGAFAGYIRD